MAGALSVDGASLPAGALLSTLGASVPAVPAVVPLSESPPPHAAASRPSAASAETMTNERRRGRCPMCVPPDSDVERAGCPIVSRGAAPYVTGRAPATTPPGARWGARGTVRSPAVTDRQLISSGGPWELIVGYSRAVRVGDRVFVAGTAPQWPDDTVDPDPAVQARRCFEIIGAALEQAGATFADVVRTRVYLVDSADFEAVSGVHGEHFHDIRPANTTVVVKALLNPAWKVEVEVEAVIGTPVPARS